MQENRKSHNSSTYRAQLRELGKLTNSRIARLILVTLFVLAVVYVGMVMARFNRTVTRVSEIPRYSMRLEIIDVCEQDGLMSRVGRFLSQPGESGLEVLIVDSSHLDLKKLSSSIIMSREKDKTAAVLLAHRLGLDESQVVYKALDYNQRHVSVTLVLGDDLGDREFEMLNE